MNAVVTHYSLLLEPSTLSTQGFVTLVILITYILLIKFILQVIFYNHIYKYIHYTINRFVLNQSSQIIWTVITSY